MLRRLLMDDNFLRGEIIYTFDGDAAGQAAALKAFEGDQKMAGQTYIAVAPDGHGPVRAAPALRATPLCATWWRGEPRCSSS